MRTLIFAVCVFLSSIVNANDVVLKHVPLIQGFYGFEPVLVAVLNEDDVTGIQIENANTLPISCVFVNEHGEIVAIGVGGMTQSKIYVFQGIFKHEQATCSLQYRA